jgi:hypothetical protein
LTAAIATFALNAAECARRVLFVIFKVPLSALLPTQAPSIPLIRLSEFARPPLVYVAHLEAVRTLVPSGRYGLHPDIPLSKHSRAARSQTLRP